MISDHDKITTGGSVSNHFYGRAVDIATVDGQPVGPGNQAARELAMALSSLDPSIRPSEIGSPWALPGAAYFTDGAHQNHLHIAFDDPIAPSWQPPPDLAADGRAGAGARRRVGATPAGRTTAAIDDSSDGDDDGADEPGGLEDPGGDTDAEADEESDGGGGDDDETTPSEDDPSDEEEDDENEDDEDEDDDEDDSEEATTGRRRGRGVDGDHDDSGQRQCDSDDSDGSAGDIGGSGRSISATSTAAIRATTRRRQRSPPGWAARRRSAACLPELPVMAGLVESGLRNLKLRRRGLGRLLPDAGGNLEPGRLRRLSRQAPSCSSNGSSTRPVAVKQQRVASGKPSTIPAAMASGSPTSRTRQSSSATATSCASRRRAACSGRAGAAAAEATASSSRWTPSAGGGSSAPRAGARWPPSPRRRGTSGRRTAGAARHPRPASIARASCSGPTPRPASRSRV